MCSTDPNSGHRHKMYNLLSHFSEKNKLYRDETDNYLRKTTSCDENKCTAGK